jgi:hypothetical protein
VKCTPSSGPNQKAPVLVSAPTGWSNAILAATTSLFGSSVSVPFPHAATALFRADVDRDSKSQTLGFSFLAYGSDIRDSYSAQLLGANYVKRTTSSSSDTTTYYDFKLSEATSSVGARYLSGGLNLRNDHGIIDTTGTICLYVAPLA